MKKKRFKYTKEQIWYAYCADETNRYHINKIVENEIFLKKFRRDFRKGKFKNTIRKATINGSMRNKDGSCFSIQDEIFS